MTDFRADIVLAAGRHGLDPDVVQALIEQESRYEPWAWNPEPRYAYLWDVRRHAPFRALSAAESMSEFPPKDFYALAGDGDQEFWGQQASWGLMQIMGAVAREQGFTGPYLPELLTPNVNLEFGCKYLASLIGWARGKYTGLQTAGVPAVRRSALAAWNGGRQGNAPYAAPLRNGAYAEAVLTRYERIRTDAHA